MKVYEFLVMRGFRGLTDEILIEAPDQDFAEIIFENKFPKKILIDVNEFIYKSWMKPIEQLGVVPFPHPQLDGIDFTNITTDDILRAVEKAVQA